MQDRACDPRPALQQGSAALGKPRHEGSRGGRKASRGRRRPRQEEGTPPQDEGKPRQKGTLVTTEGVGQ